MNKTKRILFIYTFLIINCIFMTANSVDWAYPKWNTYGTNVMYSGQYSAINPNIPRVAGSTFTFSSQTIYRSEVTSNFFLSIPNIVLSLMGFNQSPPLDTNIAVGFDVLVHSITNTNFQANHSIFGSTITYLHYMYLAYIHVDYSSQFYI